MDNQPKVMISWDEFFKDAMVLCKKIQERKDQFHGIVCITRGGLVPTAILASHLDIRNIEVFSIKSYSDSAKAQVDLEATGFPEKAVADKGKGWLLIDELVDTANTMTFAKKYLPESSFYSVYSKVKDNKAIEYYVRYFDKGQWLVFPWEKD